MKIREAQRSATWRAAEDKAGMQGLLFCSLCPLRLPLSSLRSILDPSVAHPPRSVLSCLVGDGRDAGERRADRGGARVGVIERQGHCCEYLLFEQLSRVPRLAHGVFTRRGGVSLPPFDGLNLSSSTGDDPARVGRNRALAAAAVGLPLVAVRPVHGAEVVVIDAALVGEREDPTAAYEPASVSGSRDEVDWLRRLRAQLRSIAADSMVTDQPGFALFWAYGDCAPILLADPRRGVVGLVHAGWRGAAAGVVPRTVAVMRERFGTDPHELLAAVGPAIGACCYEVNASVQAAFAAGPVAETACLVERAVDDGSDLKLYLDVAATAERQLRAAGIPAEQIESSGYCTGCTPDLFYSNRRGPRHGGRFGVGIGLRAEADS